MKMHRSRIFRTLKLDPGVNVPCKGDSIWMNTRGLIPIVTEIIVELEGWERIHIWVKRTCGWEVYTDTGFEKGISKILSDEIGSKIRIGFTEQGMQEARYSSMQSSTTKGDKALARWIFEGYTDVYKLAEDLVNWATEEE